MCGIIGIISNNNLPKKVVDELKKLEYRGYDSAGLCIAGVKDFYVYKQLGEVAKLSEKVDFDTCGECAIGHTRWATHGKANLINCHPHLSFDGEWAVVHNGIIENYLDLRHLLQKEGINFRSATDTESVANLLGFNKVQDIKGISKTIKQLKGSYALAMINKNIKGKIFLARKDSPLYIAKCGEDIYVSSDIVSFYGKASEFFAMENDELATVSQARVEFFDASGKPKEKSPQPLVGSSREAAMQEYGHYMLKEIFETPSLLQDVYRYYTNNDELIYDIKRLAKQARQILLIGCGTAYHSALVGELFLKEKVKKPVITYIASEFIYDNTYIDSDTLAIFISQSGETADTISALKKAKAKGAITIAITNNVNSGLAFLADYTLPVLAGVEIAVASTKAYNCQCFVMGLVASFAGGGIGFVKDFSDLVYSLQGVDTNLCLDIAKTLKNKRNVYFIGRGIDYITSMEASLKLKEISYINTLALPSGELKHGSLALIEKGSLVFMPITDNTLKSKSLISLQEVKARGAKVVVLSPFGDVKKMLTKGDVFIHLKDIGKHNYQVATMYFQLIAYYTSITKGINPDKPRNLAKSVTVE